MSIELLKVFSIARELDEMGLTDVALDVIFSGFDVAFKNGDFDEIDRAIRTFHPDSYSVDIIIGVFSATLPGIGKLKRRREFVDKCKDYLVSIGELEDGLLDGLE